MTSYIRSGIKDALDKIALDSERPCLLVTDDVTGPLLGRLFEPTDLISASIRGMVDLSSSRLVDDGKCLVYLILPTLVVIQSVIADLSKSSATAYILALYPTGKDLLALVKKSPAKRRIHGWTDLNFEFIPTDSRSFCLPLALNLSEIYAPASLADLDACLVKCASGLVSLLSCLQQTPQITYYDPSGSGTNVSARLACHLKRSSFGLDKANWTVKHPSAHVILLDRASDMFSPLIHSLTFEAALHDLMNVSQNKMIVPKLDVNGVVGEKSVSLQESDPIWLKLRHLFIADVAGMLVELIESNSYAARALRRDSKLQVSDDPTAAVYDQLFSAKEGVSVSPIQTRSSLKNKSTLN